jgi:hypothetical protein
MWIAPPFPCEVLGDHRDITLAVQVGPREVPAGDDAVAHRHRQARRDELEESDRRNLPLGILAVVRRDCIVPPLLGQHRRVDQAAQDLVQAHRD